MQLRAALRASRSRESAATVRRRSTRSSRSAMPASSSRQRAPSSTRPMAIRSSSPRGPVRASTERRSASGAASPADDAAASRSSSCGTSASTWRPRRRSARIPTIRTNGRCARSSRARLNLAHGPGPSAPSCDAGAVERATHRRRSPPWLHPRAMRELQERPSPHLQQVTDPQEGAALQDEPEDRSTATLPATRERPRCHPVT